MMKFVVGLVLLKVALITVFVALAFPSCTTTAQRAAVEATPTPAAAVEQKPAVVDKIDRPVSEPYTGDLSIFENPERAKNLQIDRVMDILKITEGKSVADVGAGSGWFTVRAAKRVGERGKVFAVEINPDYVEYIAARAKREGFANVETVLGVDDDPKLAAASIDACLLLKTYHEIAEPIKVLQKIRKALKPGARLGIIDRNGTGDDHGLDKMKVVEEAKRAGFALKEQYDFTKADGMDYFLVFEAAP